jgi:hypothetical protein
LRFVVASALLAALALAALRASATVSSPRATALTESQLGGCGYPPRGKAMRPAAVTAMQRAAAAIVGVGRSAA